MRLLANENVPRAAILALLNDGHDVTWVREVRPGTSDAEVLAWAVREQRILLTFDKDFGERARHAAMPVTCGVILLRIPMSPAAELGTRIARLVSARQDWAGHFSVIEAGRVRMRPLSNPHA